jgi:hypothetical protein
VPNLIFLLIEFGYELIFGVTEAARFMQALAEYLEEPMRR